MSKTEPLACLPPPMERRRLREVAGFSQDEVALVLDVTERTFGYWESSVVARPNLSRYLRALGAFRSFESLGVRCDDVLGTRRRSGSSRGTRRGPYASTEVRQLVRELAIAGWAAREIMDHVNAKLGEGMSFEAVKRMRQRALAVLAGAR